MLVFQNVGGPFDNFYLSDFPAVCVSNRFGLRFTELQNVRYLTIAEMTSKMTLREYYNCCNAHRKPTASSPKTTGSFKTGQGGRMKKPAGSGIVGPRW